MKRIIVVDDDAAVRGALRSVLQPQGYSVTEADDGKTALQLPELESADLVITDLVMPDVEGISLILQLRRERPDLKILALSGSPGAGRELYLEMACKLGASSGLCKPIRPNELLDAVRALIGD